MLSELVQVMFFQDSVLEFDKNSHLETVSVVCLQFNRLFSIILKS